MIIKRTLPILAVSLMGSAIIHAEGSPAAQAPAEGLPATEVVEVQKPEPYVLKNRSAFGIARDARAPFWPIGWTKSSAGPAKPKVVKSAQKIEDLGSKFLIEPRHFTVTSVLSGNPPLVTINGRSFGEGEVLPVVAGNAPIRVVIRSIRDGGVVLQQDDHAIFVPLNRPKYEPKAAAEPAEAQDFTIKIQ